MRNVTTVLVYYIIAWSILVGFPYLLSHLVRFLAFYNQISAKQVRPFRSINSIQLKKKNLFYFYILNCVWTNQLTLGREIVIGMRWDDPFYFILMILFILFEFPNFSFPKSQFSLFSDPYSHSHFHLSHPFTFYFLFRQHHFPTHH